MSTIEIFSADYCGACQRAKQLLDNLDLEYTERDIGAGTNLDAFRALTEEHGVKTIPQILINDKHIGGFDELNRIVQSGRLWEILK